MKDILTLRDENRPSFSKGQRRIAQYIIENYDKEPCKKTLVIGDAGCDLFAAKAAGCDFLAVLTGISGESARAYFLQEGADYVLSNILELLES